MHRDENKVGRTSREQVQTKIIHTKSRPRHDEKQGFVSRVGTACDGSHIKHSQATLGGSSTVALTHDEVRISGHLELETESEDEDVRRKKIVCVWSP